MAKFRLTTEHLYWWPVTIEIPNPDQPGKWSKQSMTMQFCSMTSGEAQAINDRIEAIEDPKKRAAAEHDHLVACCKDWRDVVEDDGETEVPFSEEALRTALSIVWNRVGIYRAWSSSQLSEEARRGN